MKKTKTALVTGANKGIGRETVRRLAELDMTVLVGARDRGRGEAAVDGLRKNSRDVHLVVLDVADEQSVARAAADVAERFGKLDVLVNNAGVALGASPPSNQGLEAMRHIFATNVFGAIAVLWIRWFVKNRRIFGPATRTARLVDDIYSPGAKRGD